MTNPDLKCGDCGHDMRISSGVGRIRRYRGEGGYVIPAALEFPVCPSCGAEWLTDSQIDALSDALELQRLQRGSRPSVVQVQAFTKSGNFGITPSRTKANVGHVKQQGSYTVHIVERSRANEGSSTLKIRAGLTPLTKVGFSRVG